MINSQKKLKTALRKNKIEHKALVTKLTPLRSILDYAEGSAASTEFLLKHTGVERVCLAFSQGYTEHDIAEFYGSSIYTVRNYIADLSDKDLRKTREAKRSFCETMITNLSSLGVRDLSMQYDVDTVDEDGSDIDNEALLQNQMKAAMLAEKRIKSIDAMIRNYQRTLKRIDGLLDEKGKVEGSTVNHAVIINPNFVGILPD